MSKDKYAKICLPQMETIVSIILLIYFAKCGDWKIGKYRSNIPQFVLGNNQPRDALRFRPIESERRSLMHYKLRYLGCQSRYILILGIFEPKTVSLESETHQKSPCIFVCVIPCIRQLCTHYERQSKLCPTKTTGF